MALLVGTRRRRARGSPFLHQAWDLAGSGASDELGCSLVLPTLRMAVLQTTLSNRAFVFFLANPTSREGPKSMLLGI